MGISNYAIDRALWMASNNAINVIYTMPTASDVNDFSQTRFNPIIRGSSIKNVDVDNVKVKKIGESFIYFKGTWDEKQAISVPSDFNIHDEIDRSKPDIAEMFSERLSASRLKWRLFLSTPTFENYGIDALWQETDQRKWFVKCLACSLEQVLTEKHIHAESDSYRCENCGGALNNQNGAWRKTRAAGRAGFHISQLMAGWITPAEILKKKSDYKFKADYYNFVLGECYAGGENKLTRLDMMTCAGDIPYKPDEAAGIGIDWGDVSWLVVRQNGNIIFKTKIEGDTRTHAKQAAEVIRRFENSKVIADFGYGDTKNKDLIDWFPNRVWMCIYAEGVMYPKFNDTDRKVNIDRTRSIEECVIDFKERRSKISKGDYAEEFIQHHLNLVEKKTQDRHGRVRITYDHIGDDHFVHANNYASLFERGKEKTVSVDEFSKLVNEVSFSGSDNEFSIHNL